MIFSSVSRMNNSKDALSVDKKLPYIQKKVNELYTKMFNLINKKEGFIKSGVLAGRMNYTSRNVIISNPGLAADEIILSYISFLEMYKFEIIQKLASTQNITESQAYTEWYMGTIKFSEKIYKNIHIKIFDNSDNDMLSNYLSVYLRRYIEKIDERCIFCLPESNQAAYFGIDVQFGGFKNCKDNVFGVLYNEQLSLNDFDRVINEGFSRNKLIMRQVVPMSFLFNISDILTRNEYNTFINGKVKISGWYERNGMKYDFYDFDTDYKKLLL